MADAPIHSPISEHPYFWLGDTDEDLDSEPPPWPPELLFVTNSEISWSNFPDLD